MIVSGTVLVAVGASTIPEPVLVPESVRVDQVPPPPPPAGVPHVPSPRQNVVEDAPMPLFKFDTGRLFVRLVAAIVPVPVVPKLAPVPTSIAAVVFVPDVRALNAGDDPLQRVIVPPFDPYTRQ